MSCNGDCQQGRVCTCECKMTKDEQGRPMTYWGGKEALAETQEADLSKCPKCGGEADNGHDRCIPPSPYYCTKCNETQHWLCLDGQMVVAQLYNLVEILNDPMRAYPHNFSTPAKGNALLFGLCQEAADEIERLKAETQKPVHTNGDRTMSMKDRNFTSEGKGYIQDNNFDFDAGLRIGGDFVNDELDQYAQMICNALNTTPPKEEPQEPVAYQPTSQEQSVMHQAMIRSSKLVHKATPPSREWQSLSDEEIEELYGDCSIEYFRDIEAKLREKNG